MPEEHFSNFNRLAKEAKAMATLRPAELRDIFEEIHAYILEGIGLLLRTTTFVEDNLCYQLARIASSSIASRKLYRGRWVKGKASIGEGVEVGSENARILGIGFDLFKLSRLSREVAVPLTQKTLRSLRLSPAQFEQILLAFSAETDLYCDTLDRLAAERLALQRMEAHLPQDSHRDPALVKQMQVVSRLIDRHEQIEASVGCAAPFYMYGVVAAVKGIVRKIKRRQERIVRSYLRLVPATVKRWAISDLNAEDMFQAGSIGLAHAVSEYDYRGRTSFPRYARNWIRQRIQSAYKGSLGPMIRISGSRWKLYRRIQVAERKLQEKNPGEVIGLDDIAAALNIAVEQVDETIAKIRMAQALSLEEELGHDESGVPMTRANTIPDEAIEDQKVRQEQQEHLLKLIQDIDLEQRRLVCLRYGFVDGVDNSIDAAEGLAEQLRQLACKTIQCRYLAARINHPGLKAGNQEATA